MESNPEGGEYAGSSLLEHLDHFLTISNLETLPLILNLFELEINLAFWSLIMSFNAWLLLPFIVVLMLIGASALVSGSEIAYFSLSPQQIKALQSDQNPANERILKLLENPSDLLATILIANNVFNIGIILCSHYLTSHLLHLPEEQATLKFLIEIVGITFILVLFGEVMPKVYATHYNARLAAMASRPLKWLYTILAPASRILARSTAALERKIDDHRASDISKQEINQAIDIVARGKVQTQDITMLKGIVGFGDLQVKQIMCSRMDMFAVDYELNFEELKEAVIKEGFSRVPVYKADADHIEGILYLKDLLKSMNQGKDFVWQALIRPAFFVPENKQINELLKVIQKKRTHLAIAVDEYGGVTGLITLEDILEEIVGDIQDEYDTEDDLPSYEKLDEHNFIFEGRMLLHDMCKFLKISTHSFDPIKGDADTIAGLLLEIAQEIPEVDAKHTYEQFLFQVLSKDNNRIEQVKITLLPDETN